MEPFELKLHQVTFDERDRNIGQGEGHTQSQLNSFNELVHYDANFEDKTGSDHLQESSNLHDLAYAKAGREQPIQASPSQRATNTTTTSFCLQPRTASTHTTSSSRASLLPWEATYAGDSGGQENFLVNADDYFLPPAQVGRVSPESAAASLRTLAHVSINTAAVARHLRKVQGGKRRIAKTTLITTALTTPKTMPSETSTPSATPAPTPTAGAPEAEASEAGDSSFETVAEALRLQWSVIGNASITPASPEEVARIVAEAEKRLRGESGATSLGQTPALPSSRDPNASDTQSVESVSSLSSLSSSTTTDNGAVSADTDPQKRGSNSGSAAESLPLAELIRIPAHSIRKEVERTSWFQSKDKWTPAHDEVAVTGSGSSDRVVTADRPRETVSRSSLGGVDPQLHTGLDSPQEVQSGLTRGADGLSASSKETVSQGKVPVSVPFGTGVTSPADLSFKSPMGSTPYASPFPESTATPKVAGFPQQNPQQMEITPQQHVVSLQQHAVASQQQRTPTRSPSSHSLSSSSYPEPANDADPDFQISAPLPVFNPNLVPIPQIGPLFPKKGNNFSPQKLNFRSSSGSSAQRDGYEELLREKLKLEGQLEVLQEEAQTTLQERAELQAQLASLQLKLKIGQQKVMDEEKAKLRAELERLRVTRLDHEREAVEVQQMLEEKLEEMKMVTEDLYQSQDTVDKLQVRMKELRDDLQAREVTVQALKSKIAELYVEVQTTLQSKMEADAEARTARSDLVSLVKAKEWYQEQLSTAHEVRAKLQRQLTQFQAQTVAQSSIVERLKLESGRLRQQLRESQERALRDKEQLARHLETIQQDMMEREAAFQEIQRERLMIEDTFNTQVTTVEEEKSRISNLLQLTSELESQLEQAHNNSKKKQEHIFTLENEQMELMKKMTLTQEVLVEKEQLLEEADQKLIEMESQLEAFTKTLTAKDAELLKLREDKASTEIALKAALQEKDSVDRALDTLKGDMGKVEKSFKQMRQELGTRVTELETAQTQQKTTRDELDRIAHELDIKTRSVEMLTHSHQEQTTLIQQLQGEKSSLEQQVVVWKQQLERVQSTSPADAAVQEAMQTELQETKARLADTESRLQVSTAQLLQAAAPLHQETSVVSDEKLQALVAEKDSLQQQLDKAQEEKSQSEALQLEQVEELQGEVDSLKSQCSESRSEFERQVQTHVEQIRGVTQEKQRLETELEMTRRKFELGSVQQQEQINTELQNLMKELEAAQLQKQGLERQLQTLQAQKDEEVAALRQQLVEMRESLQAAAAQQAQQQDSEALNQQLALDLEKERGRIAGLQQSNATLKDHMKQLEEALAGRESSLVELNSHLERSNHDREKEQQEYLKRIQDLELSLKKEKDGGRDLRKQIGTKITENKRLAKQQDVHKKEQVELQEEVERRCSEATGLRTDLKAARQSVQDLQGELQSLQGEKHALEAQLERAKRELTDNADRNPVLLEQIQSLEWQVSQRSQEVQAAREQLALAQQRQANEMDSLRRTLQDKQEEVDTLQAELASVRQEKTDQKSRVSELRGVLKASVQHHKLTKKLNSGKKENPAGDGDNREEKATQADMDNGVIIPPLPFDMDAVEQLLLDTAIKPLDSKPLDNLSTCLSSLRAEISGLQKQMEVHTTTIHSSTQSWRSVESEVKGLQEVVRSIANTIMDATHTNTTTTTSAGDTETVDDNGIVHL